MNDRWALFSEPFGGDWACAVAGAFRSLRSHYKIGGRRPVKIGWVCTPMLVPQGWMNEIKDEANLRELVWLDQDPRNKVKLNWKAIGTRLGSAAQDAAKRALAGDVGRLLPSEYERTYEPAKTERLVDDRTVVFLDPETNAELEEEGAMRLLVREINRARAEAGLGVGDDAVVEAPVPERWIEWVGVRVKAARLVYASTVTVRAKGNNILASPAQPGVGCGTWKARDVGEARRG